jgi:transcriptional regulator of heat shock response
LEAEAKRCEESLKKNGYDVEYIKISQKTNSNRKKELEDMKSYIDEIQKIIAELESELDSKFLYSDETDRVRKQDELQKKKDKLAKLQSDFDRLLEEIKKEILENDNKIYHVIRQKKQKEL